MTGQKMDWDKLRVFHAVAEAGSFTHAGDTLNLSQSAVSRQISALEEALAVPLFHRHARGLILTEQGEQMNRTVREVFAKLAMTEALLTESKEKPTGRLKVTTTVGFGGTWLAPRLQAFLEMYPDVSISLLLDDSDLDLAMRQADVAIRMHPPKQPDLIQRHLMEIDWVVCASAEYIVKHGTPETAEQLDDHKLVLFGDYHAPVDDTDLDLAMREADVAIRMHPPRQPDLVQRHIGEIRYQIWASTDYVKAHGAPETVEDLDKHKLVLFGDRKPPVLDVNWLAELGRRDGTARPAVMEVNSLQAIMICVRAGIGIGAVPDCLVQDQTGLVAVLPEVKKPHVDMYFVYPEELRNSKRVSVFRDFLVNSIAERNAPRA